MGVCIVKNLLLGLFLSLFAFTCNAQTIQVIPGNTIIGNSKSSPAAPQAVAMGAQIIINVKSPAYGAKGDCSTNDLAAFNAAVAAVNAAWAGSPQVAAELYIPAGCYQLAPASAAGMTQFASGVPGKVQGDGTTHTLLNLGANFTGPTFSWQDTNQCGFGTSFCYGTWAAGAGASDFTITGSTASTGQSGLVFYNKDDRVLVQNISMYYINGAGISVGSTTGGATQAYMRESRFFNIDLYAVGSTTAPAFQLGSTTTVAGCDATNEIRIYGLEIYRPAQDGFVIDTNYQGGGCVKGTDDIMVFGLRLEDPAATGDLIRIGGATNTGTVYNVQMHGVEIVSVASGSYALHLAGSANNINQIYVNGFSVGSGAGTGIQIDQGTRVKVSGARFVAGLANGLVVASSASVGCCIYVENYGAQVNYSIDPTSLGNVFSSGTVAQNGAGFSVNGNLILNGTAQSAPSWTFAGIGMSGTGAIFTDTTATGTVPNESLYSFPGSTLASTGAATVTNLETLWVPTPVAGTNITATNLWSINAQGGITTNQNIQSLTGATLKGATVAINGSSNFNTNVNTGTSTGTATIGGTTAGNITNLASVKTQIGGGFYASATAPTISSHFNTSGDSIVALNTAAFQVTVGTGTGTTTGVVTMPTASNGWACSVNDVTTPATNLTQQTATTTTTVTVTNYVRTTGVAGNFTNSDKLVFLCGAF